MNKKHLILVCAICAILLNGCATVNFSANYYTPPEDYKGQVMVLWDEFMSRASFLHDYKIDIGSERDSHMGIPEVKNGIVNLPDSFIKYAFQNYYKDRYKIFLCVIAHEVCHIEYNLTDSSTLIKHFEVDQKAIEMLKNISVCSASDYYESFMVLKDYWFARKGMGGHLANAGWNVANAASVAFGGPGYFIDWYATDLGKRLDYISKWFGVKSGSRFERSQSDNKTEYALGDNLESLFIVKRTKNYAGERDNKLNFWLACESVKTGMTESQVVAILSKPDSIIGPGCSGHSDSKGVWINACSMTYNYKDDKIVFSSPEDKNYKVSACSCNTP